MATTAELLADIEAAFQARLKNGVAAHSTGDQSYSFYSLEELQSIRTRLRRELERESRPKYGGRTYVRARRD